MIEKKAKQLGWKPLFLAKLNDLVGRHPSWLEQ